MRDFAVGSQTGQALPGVPSGTWQIDPRIASSMVIYQATLRHRYVLVRGSNPEFGNAVDTTVEV